MGTYMRFVPRQFRSVPFCLVAVTGLVLPACTLLQGQSAAAPPAPSSEPGTQATASTGTAGGDARASEDAGAQKSQLQGPAFKALSTAAQDFMAEQERDLKNIPDPKLVTDSNRCFARIESYDLSVREGTDRYVIDIIPVAARCGIKQENLKGGDAAYEISKDGSFRILKKNLGE